MSTLDILVLIFGSLIGLLGLVSLLSVWGCWWAWSNSIKHERAARLLRQFLTDPFLVRARMVSMEYLLPDPRNAAYQRFANRSYQDIDEVLRQSTHPAEQDVRACLRAIPDFFLAVDAMHRRGLLRRRETLFSEIYAWYWVNLMEERTAGMQDTMGTFREHKWMRTESDLDQARQARTERIRHLSHFAPTTPAEIPPSQFHQGRTS